MLSSPTHFLSPFLLLKLVGIMINIAEEIKVNFHNLKLQPTMPVTVIAQENAFVNVRALSSSEMPNFLQQIRSNVGLKEHLGEKLLKEVADIFQYHGFGPKKVLNLCCETYADSPLYISRRLAENIGLPYSVPVPNTEFITHLANLPNTIFEIKGLCEFSPIKPPSIAFIVLEGSDLHSIVDILAADAFTPKKYQDWRLSTILVQESILDEFKRILAAKCVDFEERKMFAPEMNSKVKLAIETAQASGIKADLLKSNLDESLGAVIWSSCFNFQDGPIIQVEPFRRASEGITLAKKLAQVCAFAVWGGNLSTCLAVANELDVSTVWLDCYGLHHPGVSVYDYSSEGFFGDRFRKREKPPAQAMLTLLNANVLPEHFEFIGQLLRLDSIAVPENANVIIKNIRPIGTVIVFWTKDVKELVLFALACGNAVDIVNARDAKKADRDEANKFCETLNQALSSNVVRVIEFEDTFKIFKKACALAVDSESGQIHSIIHEGNVNNYKNDFLRAMFKSRTIWFYQPPLYPKV